MKGAHATLTCRPGPHLVRPASQPFRKKRVLFVVLQLDAGGSERVVLDLAKNLDHARFEIYLATFKGGVLQDPLRKICKKIFFIRKKKGTDITAMIRIARIIRSYDIDVVNAHHYMPFFYSFLGARCLNDSRLVYTEHSGPEVEGVARSIHGKIFSWLLHRVDAVVGVSNAITHCFRQNYPRHTVKFHTIINGLDIGFFRNNDHREEIRRRFGLNETHFVVGTVANFKKVKNHLCILRAAARLNNDYPQLRLLFVGTGYPDNPDNTETLVRETIAAAGLEKTVILAGYQADIPSFLKAFDAFCLSSFSEGLPVSVLEAMAAGIPVIGSRVAGIVEVVENNRTGLLFPSDDDEQLASAIRMCLEHAALRRMLGEKGFRFVEEKHNMKKWIDHVSAVLSPTVIST